jgi:hypothetical protein
MITPAGELSFFTTNGAAMEDCVLALFLCGGIVDPLAFAVF